MKTYIILILTIIYCNFCYSQQLDKDIEILKKEIIGTWVSTIIDTAGFNTKYYYTEKHTFTSKKYTISITCAHRQTKTKTIHYSFKKTYIEELGKEVITLVFPESGKLTSYEYIICEDKNLKDYYAISWQDVVIKNGTLTFHHYFDNPKEYTETLIKEKKTNR